MAINYVGVTGLKEMNEFLKTLAPKVAVKVLKGALVKAAEPILHAARAKAPVDTGLLVSQIQVRTFASFKKGRVGARVTARSKNAKADPFYGQFIEYGYHRGKRTRWVKKNKKGKQINSIISAVNDARPFVPAQPFMRPAYDENKEKSLAIFTVQLKAGIEEIVRERRAKLTRAAWAR